MNLIKSTGTFGFYTVISRLLGYLRDILIAIFLGTGLLADAFFVAFRIPNTFRRMFAEGTFNAAFVPSYSSELRKGKKKSNNFANDIFNLLFLGLLFLTIIIEIFMPAFVSMIAPGFVGDFEKMEVAINLTRITFPFLLFICLASFFSAILNSHNKFASAAAAPIILNIVLILILIFFKTIGDKLVYYLSYGVSLAGFLQLIFLYFFVKRYFHLALNFDLKVNHKVKIFFKKLLPSIFSSGVTQINILIGTIIASFQASAVSYLYYADRIYQINLAIAGIAIGVVILPQLSKHIQARKKKKILFIQNKALELSLFLSLPASLALIIGSEQIISALFGYGSFDKNSVYNSGLALYYFALGLPAFALIKVFSRSSWFNSMLLFLFLKNRELFYFNDNFLINFIKIIFASVLMGLFFNFLLNFFQYELSFDKDIKSLYLFLSVILGLLFYLIVCYLIKAFKITDIKLKY
jgi:putative peptidoglycan lipid II flippase